MKKLCFLALLLSLTSSAHAGHSISFSFGKHRSHESVRHCRSFKCAAALISKRFNWHHRRDRYDDERDVTMPEKPAPSVPQTVSPAPPPPAPPSKTIVTAPPAPVYTAAASRTYVVDPPPPVPPLQDASVPAAPPAAPKPVETAPPAPQVERVLHQVEEETPPSDSPIGDWQTEGSGTVRIAKCGDALCGFVLKSDNERGEAILINMKPKKERQWSGGVYSQSSGETYYGTMAMKGLNTLHVEACAVGRFYCSGNNWSRVTRRADGVITSRQKASEFRS